MTTVSITLSSQLAVASKMIAKEMGMSRSEFISIAVKHEVKRLEKELQLKAMAKASKQCDYIN